MAEQQDYTGLDWVREEIENTLAEARQALELYQDDVVNPAHLTACQAAFRQVFGALKMLNQEGASRLCQEMIRLTDTLVNDTVSDRQQSLEMLMLGVLQLPAYIQQTINSGVDQPLSILPLINDLRKLRGIDLLSEAIFFHPDISFSAEAVEQPQLDKLEKSGLTSLLRKIRQKYQLCLAGYLRNQDRDKQIKTLEKIFAKLQDICWSAPQAPLWEAGVALTEGLEEQSIEYNLHTVNLLRELDHQLRFFIEQGASFINATPDDKLFREILYYLACADSSSGFIGILSTRYQLPETLARFRSETTPVLAGVDATGPVVDAINFELTGVKEALDLYLLSTNPDPLILQNQLPVIQQIADTLSILGMESFQVSLKEKAELVRSVINTGKNAEEHLMDVAGTILQLESALARFAIGESQSESNETLLIREIYRTVVKEARQQLIQTKDAIVDYIDSQHSEEYLTQIPELLHKVHGGLAMTPLSRAASLLERCARHIQLEWVERKSLPEKEELEHLADAVTSIEYYLERLDDKIPGSQDAILDVAEESLNALNPLIEEALVKGALVKETRLNDSHINDVEQNFLDGSAPVSFDKDTEVAETDSTPGFLSGENVIEFDFSAGTPSIGTASIGTASTGTASEEAPKKVQELTPELNNALDYRVLPSTEATGFEASETAVEILNTENQQDDDSFIDDELLEVFIEEAEEVQQQLTESISIWLTNQDNDKALSDIRRAFHTLKGSGRMVEANVVGELAWSVENMLNRLIDGTIQSTHELHLLIDQVTNMLPSLVNDFARQSQVLTPEVLECMEKADALAKGEQYTVPGDDTASEPKSISDAEIEVIELEFNADIIETAADATIAPIFANVSEEKEEEEPKADYDVQLLNVFLAESHLHLDTVQSFVDQVKTQGAKRQISDDVQRSLHTLKGIALMTEIDPLAVLIVALEKNIKDFRAHQIPADDRIINMLEKGLELIDDGLQQLSVSPNEPKLELEDYLGWLEAMHAQLLSEQQRQEDTTRIYTGGQKSDLFADADLKVLLNADQYLTSWREQLSSDELIEFEAELNSIRSRADDAGLDAMAELCDVLIGVVGYLNIHEETLPPVLSAPLSNGFEALIDMMNQVAAQQTPVSPQSIFSELRKSLEELLTPTISEYSEPALAESQKTENVAIELSVSPEIEEFALEYSEISETEEIALELSEDQQWASDIDVDAQETNIDAVDAEELILESILEDFDSTTEEQIRFEKRVETEEIVLEEFVIENAFVQSAPVAEPKWTEEPAYRLNVEVEEHDLELQELFLEEAGDLLEDSNLALEQWLHDVKNTLPLAELQRILHTLKGSARMADQPDIGDLSHALEDVYSRITNGRQADSPPLKMIQAAHDHIDLMVQTLKNQQTPPTVTPLIERLESWVLNNEDIEQTKAIGSAPPKAEPLPDYLSQTETVIIETRPEALETSDVLAAAAFQPTGLKPQQTLERSAPVITRIDTPVTQNLVKSNELIRVPAQLIEQLINLSGESSINRGRIEQQIQDVSQTLEEMDSTIDRVKEQLRRLDTETQAQIISTYDGEDADNPEFDPLEMDQYSELTQLSRSLVESATDLKDLKEAIQDKNRDAETLLLQQHRTQLDLQEKLIQARMVSFSRLLPRLRKISRQLSSELGKPAHLNVSNAEGVMDRTMLERMLAPLEHMLRNAIGHGLEESVDERLAKGKSAEGNLELSIARDGSDIVLELKDDGRGINLEKVHAKAIEKRLIDSNDQLTSQEIAELILEPGFTTADSITQISGRGVGLDIVNTEIRQLGGSIQIDTEKDLGTTITLRLPFTLSVNRALMVAVGENLYALPMQSIDGITTVVPEVLTDCYQNSKPLMYANQEHQVMFLGELLGSSRPRIQADQCPVIIIQRGGQSLALHVDEVIGGREIFTKSLGPQFSGLTGVNGATILGDGRVVIIIDPAALARRQRTVSRKIRLVEESKGPDVARRVLVVDDSVTVRKVTTRLLERSGFEVESARDGVEAMTRLSEHSYDIMLLDIEMPKMDGFEVASAVRNDNRIAALPIIMITSRTGEKHKTRAFSLGVNEYLGKPFQETVLLSSIDKLIGPREGVI